MTADLQAQRDRFDEVFDRTLLSALGWESVPPDSTALSAAGLDSFGLLHLMMALEDELDGMWPLEHLVMCSQLEAIGDLRLAARDVLFENGAR